MCVFYLRVISSEPGYYEDGSFGIRLENVVLVVPAKSKVRPRSLLIIILSREFSSAQSLFEEDKITFGFVVCVCEVQIQKQGQSDIRASDSGPDPSENDEHRAAHQEGGKTSGVKSLIFYLSSFCQLIFYC